MNDIVVRLRRWAIATDAVPASDLMDEAADEIERLRVSGGEREAVALGIADKGRLLASYTCEDAESAREMAARFAESGVAVTVVPLYRAPTLTDAEREAIMFCVECCKSDVRSDIVETALAGVARISNSFQ